MFELISTWWSWSSSASRAAANVWRIQSPSRGYYWTGGLSHTLGSDWDGGLRGVNEFIEMLHLLKQKINHLITIVPMITCEVKERRLPVWLRARWKTSMSPEDIQAMGFGIRGRTARSPSSSSSSSSSASLLFLGLVFRSSVGSE